MLSTVKWLLDAIPRSPKRAGLLMRLYYRWQENFTAAGHAAAANANTISSAGTDWLLIGLPSHDHQQHALGERKHQALAAGLERPAVGQGAVGHDVGRSAQGAFGLD